MNANPTTKAVTKEATFYEVPIANDYLFAVRAGIPAEVAATTVHCLADAIGEIASEAMYSNGGMDANTAYLVRFAASTISALTGSLGA